MLEDYQGNTYLLKIHNDYSFANLHTCPKLGSLHIPLLQHCETECQHQRHETCDQVKSNKLNYSETNHHFAEQKKMIRRIELTAKFKQAQIDK